MHKNGAQIWGERWYQNGTFKDYFGQQNPYLFDYQTAGDIVAIAAQGASP